MRKDKLPLTEEKKYDMKLIQMLNKEAVRINTEYREKNGKPPVAMLAVYEYQHKKAIKEMAEVKMKLEMVKG